MMFWVRRQAAMILMRSVIKSATHNLQPDERNDPIETGLDPITVTPNPRINPFTLRAAFDDFRIDCRENRADADIQAAYKCADVLTPAIQRILGKLVRERTKCDVDLAIWLLYANVLCIGMYLQRRLDRMEVAHGG